jgi:hypothetical protein
VGLVVAAYGAVQIFAGVAADRWHASSRNLFVALLTAMLAVAYVIATIWVERAWNAAANEQACAGGVVITRRPRG